MRIISGLKRGLKLVSLEGDDTRPTLDRVKEALFSMLTPYLNSARVLDLFAGSGALGIEALSRGAKEAVFVDNLPQAYDIVKQNIAKAGFEQSATLHMTDSLKFLSKTDGEFDIVFLDPPYKSGLYTDCLQMLLNNNLLSHESVVVMEWDREMDSPLIPSGYEVIKERHYGRVMISLLSPVRA